MKKILDFFFRYPILLVIELVITVVVLLNIFQVIGPSSPAADVLDPSQTTVSAIAEPSAGQQTDVEPQTTGTATAESTIAETTDDIYAGDIGAYRIDGKIVPMTLDQVTELEAKLAACQSQKEIDQLLINVAYYNRGIDYSRYEWYWESKKEYYTDEQIAILRSPRVAVKMPAILGMDYREAYDCLSDLGLVVRIIFYYNPDSSLPVGCIYHQDIDAGSTIYTNAALQIYAQAPDALYMDVSAVYDPTDKDFDLDQVVADLRVNGVTAFKIPDVVGMNELDAVNALKRAGAKKISVFYEAGDPQYAVGICCRQASTPGTYAMSDQNFYIFIQNYPQYVTVPDVVGLSEADATAAIEAAGFSVYVEYRHDYEVDAPDGICYWQNCPPGQQPEGIACIYIRIQIPASDTPSTTESTVQEPGGDQGS